MEHITTIPIILYTIAALMILESIFIIFLPEKIKQILKDLSKKKKKKIQEIGLVEFIIGFLILLIGYILTIN